MNWSNFYLALITRLKIESIIRRVFTRRCKRTTQTEYPVVDLTMNKWGNCLNA